MAGFKNGSLSLKRRETSAASDIGFSHLNFSIDNVAYIVDEYGICRPTSPLSTGILEDNIPELERTTNTIYVPDITVAIYDNPNFRGVIHKKNIKGKQFTIPDGGSDQFVVVCWNNGNPELQLCQNKYDLNQSDKIACYLVWNVNGDIHAVGFDNKGEGLANKIDAAIINTEPYRRSVDGGLIISEDGSRHILLTSAVVYAGTTPNNIYAYNSLDDAITEVFHSSSNWTFVRTVSGGVYENTKYDNGVDLVVAGNNKYIVRWIYRSIGDDKEIFIVYGTDEYNNVGLASNEKPPTIPNVVMSHCMLVGRIIIEKGAPSGLIESAFNVVFSTMTISNHNDLQNIQGGSAGERYHLSATTYNYIQSLSADAQYQINQLKTMSLSGMGFGTLNRVTKFITTSSVGDSSITDTGALVSFTTPISSNSQIYSTTLSGDKVLVSDNNLITESGIFTSSLNYINGTSANIQTQLSNLSATKVDKTTTITAGTGLAGGGDLSTNRTISLSTTGTAGTYDKVVTNAYGQVTSGRLSTSADIPQLPATKIGSGNISNQEFEYLDSVSASIQTQLSNLSATKADKTTTITAGTGLTGGGDLSTNRTISLATTGTAGTYTKVTTDVYGRVTAGTTLTSADIPTLPTSKIQETTSDRFVSDTQIGQWSSTYTTVGANSASWSASVTSAHTHSNKTNLDLINQSLNTSASPTFSGLIVGSISNQEFQYLDGVYDNIQSQIDNRATNIIQNPTLGFYYFKIATISATSSNLNFTCSLKVNNSFYENYHYGETDIFVYWPSYTAQNTSPILQYRYSGSGQNILSAGLIQTGGTAEVWVIVTSAAGNNGGLVNTSVVGVSHPKQLQILTLSYSVEPNINIPGVLIDSYSNSVIANSLTVGNVSNTEFQYLDSVSANIQTQLSNLSAIDSLKALKTTTITAGPGLTGGGDLSTNRTISLATTGTAGTYERVVTNAYGQVTSGRLMIASDLPSGIDAAKIANGSVSNQEFQYLDSVSANIQTQLNSKSSILSLTAYQLRSEKGSSLGYAAVDSNSKIYTSAIPDFILGQLKYGGSWNANTNTPTLSNPSAMSGTFYIVNVSGTTKPTGLNPNTSASLWPSGNVEWKVGDWIVSDGTYYDKVDNTDALYSWNGRLGAVVPVAGDYTASQVTNVAAGTITATNVQTALNELDSEKVPKTTTITAGTGLTGGGDLSTNRTISLATTGTAGTYTKITTNNYGQVTAGTTLTSADIPTLPTSKIQETTSDRFVSDTQIGQWDTVYSFVNSNSADWELNNIMFRQNVNVGYSRLATFTNSNQGSTKGCRISLVGYVFDGNRRGSFDLYFGVSQDFPMSASAPDPVLRIDSDNNGLWSFGYTIDEDTSSAKTYTLWAYNPIKYAYLKGTVLANIYTSFYENDVPTPTQPTGYTAALFVDKKVNSLETVGGITAGSSISANSFHDRNFTLGASYALVSSPTNEIVESTTTLSDLNNLRGADIARIYANPGETGYVEFGSFTLTTPNSGAVAAFSQSLLVASDEMGQKESAIFHIELRRNGFSGFVGGVRILAKTKSSYLNEDWLTVATSSPITATSMTFKIYAKIPSSSYWRWIVTRLSGFYNNTLAGNLGITSYPHTIAASIPTPTYSWVSEYLPDDTHVVKNPTTGQNINGQALTIQRASSGDGAFAAFTGGANFNYIVRADGQIQWGDGTNARDTNLYRAGPNALQTDDNFSANSLLASLIKPRPQPLSSYSASDPDYCLRQDIAGSDYWRIYGEGIDNDGRLVLETGDDGNEPICFGYRQGVTRNFVYTFYRTALNIDYLTPSRVLITDSNKNITASSTISTTELDYLDGTSANIQTQLNSKWNLLDTRITDDANNAGGYNRITDIGPGVTNNPGGSTSYLLNIRNNVAPNTHQGQLAITQDATNYKLAIRNQIASSWTSWKYALLDADNPDLVAIEALTGTSGFLKKTAANTWSLDTNTYLTTTGTAAASTKLATGRTISISGDLTWTSPAFDGSVNVTAVGTLASVGTAGTYKSVTTDSKGRVTAGTNPTTLAGFGITDAQGAAVGYVTGSNSWSYVRIASIFTTTAHATYSTTFRVSNRRGSFDLYVRLSTASSGGVVNEENAISVGTGDAPAWQIKRTIVAGTSVTWDIYFITREYAQGVWVSRANTFADGIQTATYPGNSTTTNPGSDITIRNVWQAAIDNWNTAYTNNHTHSNKTNLDLINQSLNTSASPTFSTIYLSANTAGNNITVGNDVFLGDIDLAYTLGIKGQADGTQGYIKFGSSPVTLGYNGTNLVYGANKLLVGDGTTGQIGIFNGANSLYSSSRFKLVNVDTPGDTNLSIGENSNINTHITLDTNYYGWISFKHNSSDRFQIGSQGTSLSIVALDATGSYIDTPLTIENSLNGNVDIPRPITTNTVNKAWFTIPTYPYTLEDGKYYYVKPKKETASDATGTIFLPATPSEGSSFMIFGRNAETSNSYTPGIPIINGNGHDIVYTLTNSEPHSVFSSRYLTGNTVFVYDGGKWYAFCAGRYAG